MKRFRFIELRFPFKPKVGGDALTTFHGDEFPGMHYDGETDSLDFGNGVGLPWCHVVRWEAEPLTMLELAERGILSMKDVKLDGDEWLERPTVPTCPYCQREFRTAQAMGGHKSKCEQKPKEDA